MPTRGSNKTMFSALVQTQHFLQALKISSTIRKIPLAQSAYAYLYKQWVPRDGFSVDVFGSRLLLDPEDMGMSRALLLADGKWEAGQTEVLRSLLREGATFVDVGANIGYYSVLAARIVGPRGRVFAFEPSPRNFAFLERNVTANFHRNVALISKAVSDCCGTTQFEIDPASSGTHRVSVSGARPNSILVETTSLDEYFVAGDVRIDLIKMDAEGAEPLILAGMQRAIKRNPNLILVTEFSPVAILDLGHSPEGFLNDLRDSGFAIHPISDAGPSDLPLACAEDSDFIRHSGSTNLLCVHHAHIGDGSLGQ